MGGHINAQAFSLYMTMVGNIANVMVSMALTSSVLDFLQHFEKIRDFDVQKLIQKLE